MAAERSRSTMRLDPPTCSLEGRPLENRIAVSLRPDFMATDQTVEVLPKDICAFNLINGTILAHDESAACSALMRLMPLWKTAQVFTAPKAEFDLFPPQVRIHYWDIVKSPMQMLRTAYAMTVSFSVRNTATRDFFHARVFQAKPTAESDFVAPSNLTTYWTSQNAPFALSKKHAGQSNDAARAHLMDYLNGRRNQSNRLVFWR